MGAFKSEFRGKKTAEKAAKSSGLALVAMLVAVQILGAFDESKELVKVGVPELWAGAGAMLVAAGLTALRNYLKVGKGWNIL